MDSPPNTSTFALVKRIIQNRWMVVVATFFIMACSGATYNYGLYSNEMKLSLHYNQETVTTIGFFKDLGANVGIFSGLLYDITGPWVVLMCGALLNMAGYIMIWLAVTAKISPPKLWQMCLYICIGANSQAFTNTGVIVTSVKNFPHNRGLVIGLLKGYVGLSGAMLTLVYHALYGDNPSSFILLIAWLPCAVCLMFMLVIRRLPPSAADKAQSEKKIFSLFLVIALVLAGYLMVVILVQNYLPRVGFIILASVMVLIVISPLVVVVRQELSKVTENKPEVNETVEAEKQELPAVNSVELTTGRDIEGEIRNPGAIEDESRGKKGDLDSLSWGRVKRIIWERPPRGTDYNIPQAVFSIDMFAIFIATTCGVGGGLMAIDNMGQIGASLGYKHREVSTFVSLISIWNFLGRVGSGYVSEMALQKLGVPRTFFFALVMGVAAVGHIVIALSLPGALYIGSIILGLTFGAQWALMFTIISEIFGLKYYGTLYNVGGVASPLGSYLLSVRVAGALYDKEAAKDAARRNLRGSLGKFVMRILKESETVCHGSHCFRLTFFIMAAVSVSGCLVALVLTLRTRKFYRGIHLRMKEQKEQIAPVKV